MNNQRHRNIDFGAGIMITWMVMYHVLMWQWGLEVPDWSITDPMLIPSDIHAFINPNGHLEVLNPCVLFPYLNFFMPWFFYKSGRFFRKQSSSQLLRHDGRKLLRTYLIWGGIGYVLYVAMRLVDGTATLRGLTYSVVRHTFLTGEAPCNGALWFLLTLFGVHVLANWILPEEQENGRDWRFHCRCGLVVLTGYLISITAYRYDFDLLPKWVGDGVAGLAFYAAGYLLSRYESKWWLLIPCGLVYLYCCIFGFPMVDMLWCKPLNGSFWLWMPVAICGIVVFDGLCRVIARLYTKIEQHVSTLIGKSLMEAIGRNAMPIYVSHVLLLETYCFIAGQYGDPSWPNFLCMSILMALLFAVVLGRSTIHKID